MRRLDRHDLDALFDQIGVVDAARAELDLAAQNGRVDGADVGHDIHGPDAILAALVDREGDDKALLGGVVFADRRNDPHVSVAVLQIKPAQQVAVGLDAVGVVNIGRLQEAEPGCSMTS